MTLNNRKRGEHGLRTSAPQNIDAVVRGRATRLASSNELGWEHILVERYLVDPEEKPETTSDCHIVVLANGNVVCHGERPGWAGHMVPYRKEPGTINLYANGVQPAIHPFHSTDLTLCALDKQFVEGVAEELGRDPVLVQKIGFRDASIEQLISLLADEVEMGGLSGIGYADHLAYALTTRLLLADTFKPSTRLVGNSLPSHSLKRVIRLIEANLDRHLSLAVLANESGYSRSHFLRMFRSATGFTPHQYLIFRRIEKAKSLMKDSKVTLVDVALLCGFSSHAHFTRAFQRTLNVTPSYFRRHM